MSKIKGFLCMVAIFFISFNSIGVINANAIYISQDDIDSEIKISQEESLNLKIKKDMFVQLYKKELEKQKKEFEKQKKEIEDRRRNSNQYYNQRFNILTSVYSTQEPIDNPAWTGLTASTIPVFDGVIAIPYDFPLFSVFMINNKIYLGLDRGNENIIKVYGKEDNKEQYMKVDVYTSGKTIPELLEIGINESECYIIRIGGNLENINDDINKMNELNNKGNVTVEEAYKYFLD